MASRSPRGQPYVHMSTIYGRLGYVQRDLPIYCLPAPGTYVTGTGIYVHGGQVTTNTQKGIAEKQSDLLVNHGTLPGAHRHISAHVDNWQEPTW